MEISAVKTVEPTVNYPSTSKIDSAPIVKSEESSTHENGKLNNQANGDGKGKKDLNKEELMQVNKELNHFMSLIGSDIQFAVHEKSKQLMVQVVDSKDHKVLKEFPSHQILDIMANIKEYVGALVDKRA